MEKIRNFKASLDTATIQLATAFWGSLLIYIFAFTLPANLFKFYNRVGLDGHLLQDAGIFGYLRIILAFLGAGILYGVGIQASKQISSRTAWMLVIGGTLAFIIVFLFMAPFDALDIYDNISHGRLLGIYGANPFHDLISKFPLDPLYKYPRWKTSTSAYGPVWEMLAGGTAWLAGNGLIANIFAFKILPGIFHIASMVTVIIYLRRVAPERALMGALLLGWNPVLLYETWGNGHNDVAMIFWVLLATLLVHQKRYTLATVSLIVGALVKFIPVLLVPVVILAGFRNLEKGLPRLWFLLRIGLASLSVIVIAYAPFWTGIASLSIGRRMQMFTTSIPAVMVQFLKPILGWSEAARLVSFGTLGVLAVFTLVQTLRAQKQESAEGFLQAAFNILAFYLMMTCLWFQQWYSLWLIGLAPLLPERSRRFAILFGFWVLSKQLIFGPLIVPIMAHKPETAIWLEPLLAFTVLGIPWLYTWLGFHISRHEKVAYAT